MRASPAFIQGFTLESAREADLICVDDFGANGVGSILGVVDTRSGAGWQMAGRASLRLLES
jgi:hypothetical protein